MNPLFKISNLECEYEESNRGIVLKVPKLEIYPGEILVILGPSGAGKSTLLEALGLMTNTIKNGKITFSPNGEAIDFASLWKDKSGKELTEVRKSNFSFVFQDTSLMPNFKNNENVCIADLIHGTKTLTQSKKDAKKTLHKLGLTSIIDHEKLPINISGGERQRVAFARAIQRNFAIIFGDEPTGNLDVKNANQLMKVLKSEIKLSTQKAKSAIIVSHSINLAIEYADRIIILTQPEDTKTLSASQERYFEVLPEFTFRRKCKKTGTNIESQEWLWECEASKKTYTHPEFNKALDKMAINGHIDSLLSVSPCSKSKTSDPNENSNIERLLTKLCLYTKKAATIFGKKYDLPLHFAKLFFEKENKQLIGDKSNKFKGLFIGLMVTLLILGGANGVLDELEQKMKDPFINSLDVMHRGGREQLRINNALTGLQVDSIRNRYYLDTIYGYNRFSFKIVKGNDFNDQVITFGKSIWHDDPLLKRILDKKHNKAEGRSFYDENDMGIIATNEFMINAGYSKNSAFVFYSTIIDNQQRKAPVPVIAVVDKLPGRRKSHFMVTQKFYDNFRTLTNQFLINHNEKLFLTAVVDSSMFGQLKTSISEALKEIEILENYDYRYELMSSPNLASHQDAFNFTILRDSSDFSSAGFRNLNETEQFFNKLISTQSMTDLFATSSVQPHLDFFQNYQWGFLSNPPENEKDEIAVNFFDTKNVRNFATLFEKETGLEIDLAKIENMQLFSVISILTNTILFVLIVIATFAILQFVYNQINSHLYKIRKNIGTLKAFGINVGGVYTIQVFTFVFTTLLLSIIFSAIIGYSVYFIVKYFNDFNIFNLFHSISALLKLVGVIVLMLFGSSWLIKQANKTYFYQAPGDLIYDRIFAKSINKKKNNTEVKMSKKEIRTEPNMEEVSVYN